MRSRARGEKTPRAPGSQAGRGRSSLQRRLTEVRGHQRPIVFKRRQEWFSRACSLQD